MSTITDMICLAAIVDFIVEVSGFTESWKGWLGRWLGVKVGRVRPFDCAMCCTHHALVIYLICVGELSLPLWAFACFLSYMSVPIGQLMVFIRDAAISLIRKLFHLID